MVITEMVTIKNQIIKQAVEIDRRTDQKSGMLLFHKIHLDARCVLNTFSALCL